MSIDLLEIGNLIKKERIKQGLSVEQLAESIGVSGRSISYWEKGQKIPTLLYADKVLKALKIEITIGKSST